MKKLYIGSSPENEIFMPHPGVKSRHAALLIYDDNQVAIEKTDPDAEVRVNGALIADKVFLNENDVLKIGETDLNWISIVAREKEANNLPSQSDMSSSAPVLPAGKADEYILKGAYRHPKETTYFLLAAFIGVLIYLLFFGAALSLLLILGPVYLIGKYISKLILEARLYGNALEITENQDHEIYSIVKEFSERLRMEMPKIFVVEGSINAFAMKMLNSKIIVLQSHLIDLMKERNKKGECAFILGHELMHIYAGHLSGWKKLLIFPAKIVPFLAAAYSRACELTADRGAYLLTGNLEDAQRALINVSVGSKALADEININSVMKQENKISDLGAFLSKLYATHPRITKRLWELKSFSQNILKGKPLSFFSDN